MTSDSRAPGAHARSLWALLWLMAALGGAALLPMAALALPMESNTGVLRAVPAPGPVTVDGSLGEWDASAEMLVYPVRQIRERYAVRSYAMWDAQALYIGLKWSDPTPMFNRVDADAAPGEGWMADCFQGRFVTEKGQIHLTSWYSSYRNKSVALFNYGQAWDNPLLFRETGKVINDPSGMQMAFVKNADNSGYVQEIRIPWNLLFNNPDPKAGLKFTFTGEYYWGGASGTKWPYVQWADPINQDNPMRIVIYQNPSVWGALELLAKGHLPKQTVDGEEDMRLQGTTPLRLTLPATATRFTVVIDDAQGRRVRNLASNAKVSDYLVKTENGKQMVEIPWDGRADGAWLKDRMLFLGDVVQAGTYTVRAIATAGVGVVHAGSFYNPGTPPWPTATGTGSWLADHSPAVAVSALPATAAGKGRVFLGAPVVEGGTGLIGVGADGRKTWEWIRQAGASHIAADAAHVYFVFNDSKLGRVSPDTGETQTFANSQMEIVLPAKATGLAVRQGQVAVAIGSQQKILFLNGDTGAVSKEMAIDTPGQLAYCTDGMLIGISGGQLFTMDPNSGTVQKFTLSGLTTPVALAVDGQGKLYVADHASSNVKVYSNGTPQAKLVQQIGEQGGRRPGKWNPQQMGNPTAVAIEARTDGVQYLWVVEPIESPRRVSVWDMQGKCVRDYIGNTHYSASGGAMSDNMPDLGLYGGVTYKIDYDKYTYQPLEVLGGTPEPVNGKVSLFDFGIGTSMGFDNPYHFVSSASGKPVQYYVEGGVVPRIYMKRGDRWLCVAALGHARNGRFTFPDNFPKPPSQEAVFSWSDLNMDGFQSPDEVKWFEPGKANVLLNNVGWGYRCFGDLGWYHSGYGFTPVAFTADGAPIYDVTKAQRLPGDAGQIDGEMYKTRFGYFADRVHPNYQEKNNVIHGLHDFIGFDNSGTLRWTYPNYWIAVHGAMTAPMAMPGVVMGSLKVSGVIDMGAYSIISIRGNIGQEFLIRDDGMYVSELFTDQRMAPGALPDDMNIAGLPINDNTLGGEPFSGWAARQDDGKVRMTYGLQDVRIAEITGLQSMVEIPAQTVRLGAQEIAAAQAFVPQNMLVTQKTSVEIARGGAFAADAKALDSAAISIVSGREEVGKAQLRYDEANLYVVWQVFDRSPFQNKGNHAPEAFKNGDSVNLFIAQGDYNKGQIAGTRMLVTKQNGVPIAVVYKPQSASSKPYVFKSPVRESPFAYVSVEPTITFQEQVGSREYVIAATIPWQVLGITPKAGLSLHGDLGILFGSDTGDRTDLRVQWVDKETNVVNDVPTEAEFFPANWGTFILK